MRNTGRNRAMQNLDLNKTADAWVPLSRTLFVPHTESEYQQLVELLDNLIDRVGEDESHPLASMMEVVGILIEKYEDEHVPELAVE
jgi:HTH-type transcriptional regulator/antitoxin HigA